MSTHKYIDRICVTALVIAMIVTLLFMNGGAFGITAQATTGYEKRLFDTSKVHQIDIVMDDWDGFLETCENEEYTTCTVIIDGESYKNIGIRAKGNTSLSSVSQMGSDRYSLKIEFDHYNSAETYYGLDKLCYKRMQMGKSRQRILAGAAECTAISQVMGKCLLPVMERAKKTICQEAVRMSSCSISTMIPTATRTFLTMPKRIEMIRTTKELIAPYVEKDPTKFCTYEEFETGVETLEQFCELRVQSVLGQLDGTIPSTTDGQSGDDSNLINASDISISDMGSMNMGGGPGGGLGGSPNMGRKTNSIEENGNSPERPADLEENRNATE